MAPLSLGTFLFKRQLQRRSAPSCNRPTWKNYYMKEQVWLNRLQLGHPENPLLATRVLGHGEEHKAFMIISHLGSCRFFFSVLSPVCLGCFSFRHLRINQAPHLDAAPYKNSIYQVEKR